MNGWDSTKTRLPKLIQELTAQNISSNSPNQVKARRTVVASHYFVDICRYIYIDKDLLYVN